MPQTTASPSVSPISRLGFGATGAWGKTWFSSRKAEKLVMHALEHRITHFDTAGFYAGGVAESRLGRFLRLTARKDIQISSKVGTRYGNGGKIIKDFSIAAIRADVNASLKRLGRDHIHTLYLHGPTIEQIEGTRNVMSMLKQEGKIGAIGVCGIGEQLHHAVEHNAADAIMGLYNAFDQRHDEIFKNARNKNIKTVAIAPLGQALYRRGFMLPKSISDVWYLARAIGRNPQELKHARHVAANALNDVKGRSPTSAMLGFALANQSVDLVLTNTTRLPHLEETIRAATGPALDAHTVSRLAKLERAHNSV